MPKVRSLVDRLVTSSVRVEDFLRVSTLSTFKQFRFVADVFTLVVIIVVYMNTICNNDIILYIHESHACPTSMVGNSQYVSTQQYVYINCTVRWSTSSVWYHSKNIEEQPRTYLTIYVCTAIAVPTIKHFSSMAFVGNWVSEN